jgi:hypothetical protein
MPQHRESRLIRRIIYTCLRYELIDIGLQMHSGDVVSQSLATYQAFRAACPQVACSCFREGMHSLQVCGMKMASECDGAAKKAVIPQ